MEKTLFTISDYDGQSTYTVGAFLAGEEIMSLDKKKFQWQKEKTPLDVRQYLAKCADSVPGGRT